VRGLTVCGEALFSSENYRTMNSCLLSQNSPTNSAEEAKTKAFLERKGIKPAKLVPSIFVPLLEEGGGTDDERLSDMFSSLLASHLDPEQRDKVHPAYAKILSQMSPQDAVVIEQWDMSWIDDIDALRRPKFTANELAERHEMPAERMWPTVHNLVRLGLLTCTPIEECNCTHNISSFGESFRAACLRLNDTAGEGP
jgi:hypothetical protein